MLFQTDALLPTPGHRKVIHPQNECNSWFPSSTFEDDSKVDSCFTSLSSKPFWTGFEPVVWQILYFPTDWWISFFLLTIGHKLSFNILDLHQTTSNMKGKYITFFASSNHPSKIFFSHLNVKKIIISWNVLRRRNL